MKVDAKTIESFFSAQPDWEHDLHQLDALIMKTLPNLKRQLKISPSITLLGYWPEAIPLDIWPPISFAPQKHYISLYVYGWKDGESLVDHYRDRLGKTSNGKGCIRFKKLSDVVESELRLILLDAVSQEWSY